MNTSYGITDSKFDNRIISNFPVPPYKRRFFQYPILQGWCFDWVKKEGKGILPSSSHARNRRNKSEFTTCGLFNKYNYVVKYIFIYFSLSLDVFRLHIDFYL